MKKTKRVVFCGILSALAVLFLYGAGVLPTGRIALYCLASCLTAVTCIECGWKYALAGFAAASALALILVPDKLSVLPYCLFLGYYPVLKERIEAWGRLGREWIVKMILFFAVSAASVAGALALLGNGSLPLSPVLLAAAGGIVLAIFDFAMSLFIQFYRERIAKLIRNGDKL